MSGTSSQMAILKGRKGDGGDWGWGGGGGGDLGGVEGVGRIERLLSLLIRPNGGGTSSSGLLKLSSSHCWPAGARDRVFAAAPA